MMTAHQRDVQAIKWLVARGHSVSLMPDAIGPGYTEAAVPRIYRTRSWWNPEGTARVVIAGDYCCDPQEYDKIARAYLKTCRKFVEKKEAKS